MLTSPAFPRVHFQFYMLSNDASRPTFNAISHEKQTQVINSKPHSVQYIAIQIYTSKYYQYSQNKHDTQKQKTVRSFVTYYITYLHTTC
jgi:hypothetical protein